MIHRGSLLITPGSRDNRFIICKPSHLHHQESQLNYSLNVPWPGQDRSFLIHLFLSLPGLWTYQSGHSSVSNIILFFFFFNFFKILFIIFGCVGFSLLRAGFL